MQFGFILLELIHRNEMTLEQFSSALRITGYMLKRYIFESREPDYKTLKRIAEYFGVSTDYLLGHDYSRDKTAGGHEERLLQLFLAMSPDTRLLMLDLAEILLKHDKKLTEGAQKSGC